MKISTGSSDFDRLLGGGVAEGILYDIYGEAGSGKTQLCFSLCANCARAGDDIFFIDTSGTFRPERIVEVAGSENVLGRIKYQRVFSTAEQYSALSKAYEISPRLIIVDSTTSLFSAEFTGFMRHLKLAEYLHNLASAAVTCRWSVVATNMIRASLPQANDAALPEPTRVVGQREFLTRTVSTFAHVKIGLKVLDPSGGGREARMTQPERRKCVFVVTNKGIVDLQN
ncbi:MAG: hypothetical protein ABI361_01980 [Nitrososphaera sp.]|jgi:RecA/RadA recombinase